MKKHEYQSNFGIQSTISFLYRCKDVSSIDHRIIEKNCSYLKCTSNKYNTRIREAIVRGRGVHFPCDFTAPKRN